MRILLAVQEPFNTKSEVDPKSPSSDTARYRNRFKSPIKRESMTRTLPLEPRIETCSGLQDLESRKMVDHNRVDRNLAGKEFQHFSVSFSQVLVVFFDDSIQFTTR